MTDVHATGSPEGLDAAFPHVPALLEWFEIVRRPLPWRAPGTSPWGVLVSEIMAQQTPVARVAPLWEAWMALWPTPADLAAAPTPDVLRMWANLGYPRRALRLKECASAVAERHGGRVPQSIGELEALPGVGSYTARAVAAFAFGMAVPVVDTNVRRVQRRFAEGSFLPGAVRASDAASVADLMPWVDDADPALRKRGYSNAAHRPGFREEAVACTAAFMELGALVCTARTPLCEQCPIAAECRWVGLGKPEPDAAELAGARKRVQKFAGTDRQVRGIVMRLLRESATGAATASQIDVAWPDAAQLQRALTSLVEDGLAVREVTRGPSGDPATATVAYRLPS